MSFSEKLRKLREEKGLSQEELAKELDTPRSSITHYERDNKRIPRTSRLIKIASFFEVSVDELLNGDSIDSQGNKTNINDENIELFFDEIRKSSPEKKEEIIQYWDFIKNKERMKKNTF